MKGMCRILTVIATYNGEHWINKCIGSLLNSELPTDVLVVDNASNDNTVVLLSDFEDIEIIRNQKNLGFGAANNLGLRKGLQEKYDFVFLLNQDAWVEKDTIGNLVRKSKKDFGILSPLHFNGKGNCLDSAFAEHITNVTALSEDISKNKFSQAIYEVSFVNAAAWLIPMNTISKVGGFDPIFIHYGEDNDYVNRVHFHGLKIGVDPFSKIYHDRMKREAPSAGIIFRTLMLNYLAQMKDPAGRPFRTFFYILRKHTKEIFKMMMQWKPSLVKQHFILVLFLMSRFSKAINHRSFTMKEGPTFVGK